MEIRIANKKDYSKLRNLWQVVFGDDAKFVDDLYESLSATGYVLYNEKNLASCLTVFDVGTYEGKTITEIYAVCTAADMRGKGYASNLVECAKNEIAKSGKVAMICPARENLIPFYEKLNFIPYFFIGKEQLDFEKKIYEIAENCSIKEYCKAREEQLKNIPHIEVNLPFLDFAIREAGCNTEYICLSDDFVIQGMVNRDSGLSKTKDSYPYFGFPMK